MRTVEQNIYEFDELSDEAKEKAIHEHRDINVAFEWWDAVFEWAVKEGYNRGIAIGLKGRSSNIPAIYFSGFWSQGDGASFEGTFSDRKFPEAHPELLERYGAIRALKEAFPEDLYLPSITCGGRYSHSNTMRAVYGAGEILDDFPQDEEEALCWLDPQSLRDAKTMLEALLEKHGYETYAEWFDAACSEAEGLERDAIQIAREFADEIYISLRDEYEHLTSDEIVAETLRANAYEFTEHGEAYWG